MDKIIRVGNTPQGDLYCRIKFNDGRLSITGVQGPLRSGNARGGCGQIIDALNEIVSYAPGWHEGRVVKFRQVWEDWHLNDMRPYCEHQKALGWRERAIFPVTQRRCTLNYETSLQQKRLEESSMDALKRGEAVQLNDALVELLNFPYSITVFDDDPIPEIYSVNKDGTRTKILGWLRPDEHPAGILTRPCPECAYPYGSEWKKEEVPQSVLDFLETIPDTDKQPAWV